MNREDRLILLWIAVRIVGGMATYGLVAWGLAWLLVHVVGPWLAATG